jgi:hypothetical protein
MSQTKRSAVVKLVPFQAHFEPTEALLILSNQRGAIVAAIKLPELRPHLTRAASAQRQA